MSSAPRPAVQERLRNWMQGWLGVPTGAPAAQKDGPAFAQDDPENPDNWVGLDYIHDRIAAQLKEQSALWESADGRLRLILGVISIVFAVALGLIPRGTTTVATGTGSATEPQYLPFVVGSMAIAGLATFFVAGFIAVRAYWPRDFDWPPKPGALPKYVTTDPRVIKWTVVTEMLDSYARNGAELERKFEGFRWSMGAVAIATVLLGMAVIIQLVLLTRAWSP
jgi:hypothetical protein